MFKFIVDPDDAVNLIERRLGYEKKEMAIEVRAMANRFIRYIRKMTNGKKKFNIYNDLYAFHPVIIKGRRLYKKVKRINRVGWIIEFSSQSDATWFKIVFNDAIRPDNYYDPET